MDDGPSSPTSPTSPNPAELYIAARTVQCIVRGHLGRCRTRRRRREVEEERGELATLRLYWHREQRDHRVAAGRLASKNLTLLGDLADVFSTRQGRTGLVALHLMTSLVRNDTRAVAAPQLDSHIGYSDMGFIGYAYDSPLSGTIPLLSYYSQERCDTLLVAGVPYGNCTLSRAAEIGAPYVCEGVIGYAVPMRKPFTSTAPALAACCASAGSPASLRLMMSALREADEANAMERQRAERKKQGRYAGVQSRVYAHRTKPVSVAATRQGTPAAAAPLHAPVPPSSNDVAQQLRADGSDGVVHLPPSVVQLAFSEKVQKLDAEQQSNMVSRLHDLHRERQRLKEQKLAIQMRRAKRSQRLSVAEEKESVERLFYDENRRAAETALRLSDEHVPDPVPKRLSRRAQSDFLRRLKEADEAKRVRHQQRLESLIPLGPPSGTPRRPRSWLELHAGELYTRVPVGSRTPRPE